ncbi:hypothetical protein ACSMXN_24170 [Jatrophihabitans sp. DSM 45814]
MAITSAPSRTATSNRQPAAAPATTRAVVPVTTRAADAWRARRAAKANAASVRDPFMDVIVLLSVLMFLALAAGVGLLALAPTLNWPR